MAAEEIGSLYLQPAKLKATEPESELLNGPFGSER